MTKEGWGWTSYKYHYFVDGNSLCGTWVNTYINQWGEDGHPENCKECEKLLKERRNEGL